MNRLAVATPLLLLLVFLLAGACGDDRVCGNNIVESGEQCDQGTALNGQPTASCTYACTVQTPQIFGGGVGGQQCCRNTAGQPGYCSQVCTGGIVGSNCQVDPTNACLTGGALPGGIGGQQCCRNTAGQPGYCTQVCTGGIVGSNCQVDPTNACLTGGGLGLPGTGGVFGSQCCRSQITGQPGLCTQVCSGGIVGQGCTVNQLNTCLTGGGGTLPGGVGPVGPGGVEQCCRSRVNGLAGRCSTVCSLGPCRPLPSLCI